MKRIIIALNILITHNLYCQDSIYKKNGEIIPAKVLEISDAQVKFKKTNNPDGPSYSELKSDLLRIKFSNGTIDTIHSSVKINAAVPVGQETTLPSITSSQQSIMYRNVSEAELFSLIEIMHASDKKNKLKREYALMKLYKRNQYLSSGLGFGIGFAVPVVVTYSALLDLSTSYYSDPVAVIVAGALVGAAIRTTGQVLMKINKNKRMNAKKNIIMLYEGLK